MKVLFSIALSLAAFASSAQDCKDVATIKFPEGTYSNPIRLGGDGINIFKNINQAEESRYQACFYIKTDTEYPKKRSGNISVTFSDGTVLNYFSPKIGCMNIPNAGYLNITSVPLNQNDIEIFTSKAIVSYSIDGLPGKIDDGELYKKQFQCVAAK